jgi:hypothetical protein
MERIELNYCYRDENDEEKIVTLSKRDENGLHDYDVCEMFVDFMNSVGFSEENVFRYFNE